MKVSIRAGNGETGIERKKINEGGRSLCHRHTCIYKPDRVERNKAGGGHKKGEIYTDTKQEMELCEILVQKRSLDCPNLGHEQC